MVAARAGEEYPEPPEVLRSFAIGVLDDIVPEVRKHKLLSSMPGFLAVLELWF